MKVTMSPKAHKDIQEIYNYISYDSLYFAQKTSTNIYSCIHQLKKAPYIGRYVPELQNKHYRELIYKSYRIVYSISENTNEIYIHFVSHEARDFKKIFNSYIKNIFNF